MKPLLKACAGWTDAKTETAREEIRTEVRRILERQGRAAADHTRRKAFDLASAEASAAPDEDKAHKFFE